MTESTEYLRFILLPWLAVLFIIILFSLMGRIRWLMKTHQFFHDNESVVE